MCGLFCFVCITAAADGLKPSWWNAQWRYRVPLVVESGPVARSAGDIVCLQLDLTEAAKTAGYAINPGSFRLIGKDGGEIAFRARLLKEYRTARAERYSVAWRLEEPMDIFSTRFYMLYFEGSGSVFPPVLSSTDILIPDPTPGENLLDNGNFSDPGPTAPRAWTRADKMSAESVVCSGGETISVLRMAPGTAVEQSVSVEPGGQYRLSCEISGEGSSVVATAWLVKKDGTSAASNCKYQTGVTAHSGWTEVVSSSFVYRDAYSDEMVYGVMCLLPETRQAKVVFPVGGVEGARLRNARFEATGLGEPFRMFTGPLETSGLTGSVRQ